MPQDLRKILVLCGAVLLVVAGIGAFVLRPSPAEKAETTQVVDFSARETEGTLLVYVSGAVKQPGVYEVPAGSRVFDAVKAAGDVVPYADMEAVNMADAVTDGSHIFIPANPEEASGAGLININTADAKQLERLPGVGEVIAGRIIAYREEHGSFQTKEDLLKVKSISPGKLEKFADQITL